VSDNIATAIFNEPPALRTNPVPLEECSVCELRPIYEHGRCKGCHDVVWYRGKCLDCRCEGKFAPKEQPPRKRSYSALDGEMPPAPKLLLPNAPGGGRAAPKEAKHPQCCKCHFCDPTQPRVFIGTGRKRRSR